MLVFARILLFALVTLAVTSCYKKTSFDTATDLMHERTQLKHDIEVMGEPNVGWSDEKLEIYEVRVNRLEEIEKQMRAINGHVGVVVSAQYSDDFIYQAHHDINRIRNRRNHEHIGDARNDQRHERYHYN